MELKSLQSSSQIGPSFELDGPIRDPEIIHAEFDYTRYAPTPLNPYSLRLGEENVGFSLHAQVLLAERFKTNLSIAMEQEVSPSQAAIDLLEIVTNNALARRLESNNAKSISHECDDESARIFALACKGQADQSELLRLLAKNPSIGSIELAKQTDPFLDGNTEEMDLAVYAAVEGMELLEKEARYYLMSTSIGHESMIVVRKRDIAKAGDMLVVQRDSVAIDMSLRKANTRKRMMNELASILRTRNSSASHIKLDPDSSLVGKFIAETLDAWDYVQHSQPGRPGEDRVWNGARSYYAFIKPAEV